MARERRGVKPRFRDEDRGLGLDKAARIRGLVVPGGGGKGQTGWSANCTPASSIRSETPASFSCNTLPGLRVKMHSPRIELASTQVS